jgi:hypothetical protein
MTAIEFENWVKDFNKEVDNASCHKATDLSNVRLKFLPPNYTGSLQLLVADIKGIKVHYTQHQVRKIVENISSGSLIQLSLKDAQQLLGAHLTYLRCLP